MRDFETLRVSIPPLVVVPGTTTIDGFLGDKAIDNTYTIKRDNWEVQVNDPGPLTGSGRDTGPFYSMFGYHRSRIEWSPWARSDVALTPLGQDVAEGKNFAGFYTNWAAETIAGVVYPAWSGIEVKVLDIWSSEEIEENMLENLAWNADIPGAEATYPIDAFAAIYYPKNNPANITHKLRFDQVISARYRQFISSTNAPTSNVWGGQMVNIHDQVIGGNASMAESIHHARYIYFVASNNGDNNIDDPQGAAAANDYNYTKVGFFVPSAIDTLTVGLNKIENDAEWATLARRGASR